MSSKKEMYFQNFEVNQRDIEVIEKNEAGDLIYYQEVPARRIFFLKIYLNLAIQNILSMFTLIIFLLIDALSKSVSIEKFRMILVIMLFVMVLLINIIIRVYPNFFRWNRMMALSNCIIYGMISGGVNIVLDILALYLFVPYVGAFISLTMCSIYLYLPDKSFSFWPSFTLCSIPLLVYHIIISFTLVRSVLFFLMGFLVNSYFAMCVCFFTQFTLSINAKEFRINDSIFLALKFSCDLLTFPVIIYRNIKSSSESLSFCFNCFKK